MRKSFLLLASLATASQAGVPNVFRPNDPAKADQVNANFQHLDSAVGAKVDTSALTVRLGGYATTNALANYASVGALVNGLGGKADTAALSAVKASIPVGVNIGGKVDTAALTVRLAGYAPTTALANFATTSSLAAYATSAALASGLGGKADTAALSAVKASIPAGVNIGGKVDTAALTTRLGGYAKTTDLASYAKSTDLSGFAKTTDLSSYAPLTSLANYAKTSDLASYAKSTDLASYAKSTDLSAYAKTTALSSYATTAVVNGKMNTADYVVSGHLKALGGITGGRGYDGVFNGSKITLDTTQVSMEAGDRFASLDHKGLIWSYGYNQWRFGAEPGSPFTLVSGNRMFDMTVLTISTSGAAQFAGDVEVGGALKVAGVTMAVPDYVFESDYKLAPLAEVEAYTQANKHLPDVPSAKDIEAGGMDLAKMNLVLLKKVEELTLHAIAQEKRIQALEANQAR